jgi:hypothetical protein
MSTAGPVHRVQSAVEVYGYPQGHIGHLTADEQNAFNDFKALLTEKGLYKSPSGTDEYGTHDDATLLYDLFFNPSSFADHLVASSEPAASRFKKHSSNLKIQKIGARRLN